MNVLADHLSGIHLFLREDEELAAVLQVVDGIGDGCARVHRDHRAVRPAFHVALVGLVVLEAVGHDGFALAGCEHVGAQADDAARGDFELDVHAVALGFHRQHFALAARDHVDHLRREVGRHVDGQFFDRFALLTADFLEDDLRLAHLQLVAFAAHGLDQHREVEHTASAHYPFVRRAFLLLHAQGEVLLQLAGESFADVARGAEFSFLAEERRVVDGEEHRHRRLVDRDGGQGFGSLGIGDGVADFEVRQADDGADVAARHLLRGTVSHALERVQFLDFRLFARAVAVDDGHRHAAAQRAAVYASHGDAARIGRVVERGNEHLGRTLQLLGCRNHLQDLVEQVGDVRGRSLPVLAHPALLGRTIDDGEVQLVLRGVEVIHQVEHHFVHLLGAAVRFVHLVHHDDGLQTDFQCFLQDEARLRHRTLEGIDEQDAAVGHVEHALHLAAEVGVSRSVDHIDLYSLIIDADILRENGDASFAFQFVVVENEVACLLVLAEQIAGQQHLVHERRLSMIDVCNDCNVSDILHFYLKIVFGCKVTIKRAEYKM